MYAKDTEKNSENMVLVGSEDDFGGTVSSGERTLDNKNVVYEIYKPFTITNKIIIPTNKNTTIQSAVKSGQSAEITLQGNNSGFSSNDLGNSGKITMNNLAIIGDDSSGGRSGKFLDFQSASGQFSSVNLRDCAITNVKDLGVVKNTTFTASSCEMVSYEVGIVLDSLVSGVMSFCSFNGDVITDTSVSGLKHITLKGVFQLEFSFTSGIQVARDGECIWDIQPGISIPSIDVVGAGDKTLGSGSFFKTGISGSISSFSDSFMEPGVKTTVLATGHTLKNTEGVTLEDDAPLQYRGQFQISNVFDGLAFDIPVVFSGSGSGTGSWNNKSLTQTDPAIHFVSSGSIPDSTILGNMVWSKNSTETLLDKGLDGTIDSFSDAGSNQVLVNSIGHGLSNGDVVDLLDNSNYSGRYTIFDATTDSFKIASNFNGSGTASWEIGWAKVLGTTFSADSERISMTENNKLLCQFLKPSKLKISANMNVLRGTGFGTPIIEFCIFRNGKMLLLGNEKLIRTSSEIFSGASDIANLGINVTGEFFKDDIIQLFARNITNTSEIIVIDAAVIVSK